GYRKGGISRVYQRFLAKPRQLLPPILHILHPISMLSYSEGSWGLSVPSRVIGVFTDTTISPSSWLRQRPDRYTIRAGRKIGRASCRERVKNEVEVGALKEKHDNI